MDELGILPIISNWSPCWSNRFEYNVLAAYLTYRKAQASASEAPHVRCWPDWLPVQQRVLRAQQGIPPFANGLEISIFTTTKRNQNFARKQSRLAEIQIFHFWDLYGQPGIFHLSTKNTLKIVMKTKIPHGKLTEEPRAFWWVESGKGTWILKSICKVACDPLNAVFCAVRIR